MTQHAITTDGLTRRFGETTAVEDLDLRVERGAVYGFLGPNGAGKTTTMRLLVGLITPTAGTGHVAGEPITDRAAIRPHVGYLPEIPPIHDELTAREQLEYHAALRDVPPARRAERIETLLERFDLVEDANDRIRTFSTGMRKKTGLIQAVTHEPDVLILDEPTSGLDPRAARTARELLRELVDDGTTVLLSTHVLPVVEQVATEVGVLYDGRLVAEGTPESLRSRTDDTLEDAFLEITTDRDEAPEAPNERDVTPTE